MQEAKAIFQYKSELLDWDLKANKSCCCSGEEAEAWPRTPVREQSRDLSPGLEGRAVPTGSITDNHSLGPWAMELPPLCQEELG